MSAPGVRGTGVWGHPSPAVSVLRMLSQDTGSVGPGSQDAPAPPHHRPCWRTLGTPTCWRTL